MGFFDTALNPYPTAYLIKSAFVPDEPLVRIAVNAGEGESVNWNDVQVGSLRLDENWNKEAGTTQTIYTFSNCEEVELLLNGKSLGRKPNNLWTSNEGLDKYDKGMPNSKKHIIQWPDVAYAKGKLVAIGYNQGREVSRHQIETTGRAVALRAEAETPNDWRSDGMDLQYIKVWAVDSKGRRVLLLRSTASTMLTITPICFLPAISIANRSSRALCLVFCALLALPVPS